MKKNEIYILKISKKYNKKEAVITKMFEICKNEGYDFKKSKCYIENFFQEDNNFCMRFFIR